MSTQLVLQGDDFSCLGCVAAMITGETIADVAAFVGHDASRRPFRMTDIAQYLACCGYLLGAYAERVRPGRMINFCWSWRIGAVVIVASASGAGTHAIYWTGREVLDPEPRNAGRKLQDYVVKEWWPVIKVED